MSISTERWLPIAGYDGLYEVSSLGQVRSKRRFGSSGGVLKPSSFNTVGHIYVDLYREGHRSHRTIHSLVAETFIGPWQRGQDSLPKRSSLRRGEHLHSTGQRGERVPCMSQRASGYAFTQARCVAP
jgi:hypothetical protein